jgi:hypothetical protein
MKDIFISHRNTNTAEEERARILRENSHREFRVSIFNFCCAKMLGARVKITSSSARTLGVCFGKANVTVW